MYQVYVFEDILPQDFDLVIPQCTAITIQVQVNTQQNVTIDYVHESQYKYDSCFTDLV